MGTQDSVKPPSTLRQIVPEAALARPQRRPRMVVDADLAEDARQGRLDGPSAMSSRRAISLFGRPPGDHREHLTVALGHPDHRPARGLCVTSARDSARIHEGSAARGGANAIDDLLGRRVLDHAADGVGVDRLRHPSLLGERRQHHHLGLGHRRADCASPRPVEPCIERSINATSGRWRTAASTPLTPSRTAATTSTSSTASSRRRSPSRTTMVVTQHHPDHCALGSHRASTIRQRWRQRPYTRMRIVPGG
jgi:hypothetical protein